MAFKLYSLAWPHRRRLSIGRYNAHSIRVLARRMRKRGHTVTVLLNGKEVSV